MSSPACELLIHQGRVVTCDGVAGADRRAALGIMDDGAVGVVGDRISWVGPAANAPPAQRTLSAQGGLIMPGWVDCHTHLVFAGHRADEFGRRMAGESYPSIARQGGGIARTVQSTRAASDDRLYELAERRATAMRRLGTTSIEIKSGYGLSLADELRMLQVARRLQQRGVAHTTATLLGAHVPPPNRDRAEYVREVVEQMIPAAARDSLADSCDVYIDEHAFTVQEARTVLTRARSAGLHVRAHIGQFADLGGAMLLAELEARSADHLEQLSPAGARALGAAGVVGVLLPGAWRTLRQTPPDVGQLRAAGVPLAVGTDCNPGTSPCVDLPLCAALAVRDAGLTAEEAVLGITRVAAQAAGFDDCGAIRPGYRADLAIYDADDPLLFAYTFGGLRPWAVLLGGSLVHERESGSGLW